MHSRCSRLWNKTAAAVVSLMFYHTAVADNVLYLYHICRHSCSLLSVQMNSLFNIAKSSMSSLGREVDLVYSTTHTQGRTIKLCVTCSVSIRVFTVDPEVDQPTQEISVLQMANPSPSLDHRQFFGELWSQLISNNLPSPFPVHFQWVAVWSGSESWHAKRNKRAYLTGFKG